MSSPGVMVSVRIFMQQIYFSFLEFNKRKGVGALYLNMREYKNSLGHVTNASDLRAMDTGY